MTQMVLCTYYIQFSYAVSIIISILQMRRPRLRKFKLLATGKNVLELATESKQSHSKTLHLASTPCGPGTELLAESRLLSLVESAHGC